MQPAFEGYWGGHDGMYYERFGEMTRFTNRYRSLLDRGIVVSGGSDSYITPIDPLLGMHYAVNHHNPAEAITPFEAIEMFTKNCAYAVHKDDRYGTLSVNMDASFVILDGDPVKSDPASIRDIPVVATYYRGKKVYSDEL
jgi:predicted amidohydrolase YtcJ